MEKKPSSKGQGRRSEVPVNLIAARRVVNLLKEHQVWLRRDLGQSFLVDYNVLRKILETAGLEPGMPVIEIGAGIGTLSKGLAEAGAQVTSIEIDPRLAEIWRKNMASYSNVRLIVADALKLDFSSLLQEIGQGRKVRMVSNIPYQITSPLLELMFENHQYLDRLVFTVQREVGERIIAPPGTSAYSSLTVTTHYYSKPRIVAMVSRRSFFPVPKVDSCLLCLEVRDKPPVEVKEEKIFLKIVRAAFEQRRKTLVNALSGVLGLPKEVLSQVLQEAQIEVHRRGETLSLEEFAHVANLLSPKLHPGGGEA